MRSLSLVLLFVAAPMCSALSQEKEYDVRRIPAGLRVDAAAVVRATSTLIEIKSRGAAVITRKSATTVFRKEGRDFGSTEVYYDQFRKVKDLDGALYDEHGEEIRTLESDDVKDESDISAYTLYDDARVRRAELYHDIYPYTVAFEERVALKGILYFPRWAAQRSEEAVVHARLEVVVPASDTLRFWPATPPPVITLVDDKRHFVWEARNLPELSPAQMEEDIEQRTVVVHLAPSSFAFDERPGSMTSWRQFGAWVHELWNGNETLPPQARADVQKVLQGAVSQKEKIGRLYQFLQNRTRYVNVVLGIGGWKPFPADYVYQRGYGDCKALSNFMVALLSEAGIRAYPALIDAGGWRSDVIPEFPCNAFNHVIVCVPGDRDSLWLECTSQDMPFGFLSDFTENRPALLLTPEGGVLVKTPGTTREENLLSRVGTIGMQAGVDAAADLRVIRSGSRGVRARAVLTHGTPEEQENWYLGELSVSGARLMRSGVTGIAEHALRLEETLHFELPRFVTVTGSRLFFRPDIAHRSLIPPRELVVRHSPVRMLYPHIEADSIVYLLPRRTKCEALPAPVSLRTSFGEFSSSVKVRGDSALTYVRRIAINVTEIPAAHYVEYLGFMKTITVADKAQVVLVTQ
jgi:hypothetical protein